MKLKINRGKKKKENYNIKKKKTDPQWEYLFLIYVTLSKMKEQRTQVIFRSSQTFTKFSSLKEPTALIFLTKLAAPKQ